MKNAKEGTYVDGGGGGLTVEPKSPGSRDYLGVHAKDHRCNRTKEAGHERVGQEVGIPIGVCFLYKKRESELARECEKESPSRLTMAAWIKVKQRRRRPFAQVLKVDRVSSSGVSGLDRIRTVGMARRRW